MRSEWRPWTDPITISWPVAAGIAHVTFSLIAGSRVENDDGTWTPIEFTYVEMPTDKNLPYVVLECEYGDDLVPRIMAVHVIRRDERREVRSSDLRGLRLEDALEEAWLKVTRRPQLLTDDIAATPADAVPMDSPRQTLRGLRRQNRRKITNDTHVEVARIYRENLPSGAPTKAVAGHFGLAASTASLYVKRARDAGLLKPPQSKVFEAEGAKSPPRGRKP